MSWATKGQPRMFALHRRADPTGVSGTGVVAWGVQWPDGRVVTRWVGRRTDVTQVTVWDRLADMVKVHGHGSATAVVWLNPQPDAGEVDPVPLRALAHRHGEALAAQQRSTRFADVAAAADTAMAVAAVLPGLLDAYEALLARHHDLAGQLVAVRAEADALSTVVEAVATHPQDITPAAGSRP